MIANKHCLCHFIKVHSDTNWNRLLGKGRFKDFTKESTIMIEIGMNCKRLVVNIDGTLRTG